MEQGAGMEEQGAGMAEQDVGMEEQGAQMEERLSVQYEGPFHEPSPV